MRAAWLVVGMVVGAGSARGEVERDEDRIVEERSGGCRDVHARGGTEDGCARSVWRRGERIELAAPIVFDLDKSTIRPGSRALLDELVAFLRARPALAIEVQGHTGFACDHCAIDLGSRRAEAVRDYLVQHGVEAAQIVARGYGETRPLVLPKTRADRVKNTRLELWIVQRTR